ncbi:MAG: CBS domain-containing protein [Actinomycetota bacterium]|nr:CBS domain-containing protein [Actinomycetota bacterium]
MSLQVSAILERKGDAVVTIARDGVLLAAAEALSRHGIGALVVSDDGRVVDGILSERDVVRAFARFGTAAVKRGVAEVMSTEVVTCERHTTIDELMALMTERRIRHVPVLADGVLVGIVSIGDIVKLRLDELEVENETLEQYVSGRT